MNGKMMPPRGPVPSMPSPVQGPNPMQVFASWSGLSGLQLEALGIAMQKCLCGKCAGVKIQLDVAMHFDKLGTPMVVRRHDLGERAETPAEAAAEKS